MSEKKFVSLRRDGQVSIVEMIRADRRNALSVAMREELIAVLSEAMEDTGTRVVILAGSEGHFCSGGDLDDFELEDVEAGRARMKRAHVLPRLLACGRKPVIAAFEGSAFGAGLSLAMMCDHVVAADNARLCASFVRAGLMPDYGLIWALQRRVGHSIANAILMQGKEFSGRDAMAAGLVDELCSGRGALEAAMATAEDLASRPPLVLEAIKATRASATGLEDIFAQEIEWQAKLFKSADFDEAVAAFREKRKPEFKGK